MSLLTEEQINDILDITNVWESGIIVSNLIEWNEKQTGVQVNVNWSKAPECAERVEVNFYWVGEDTWRFCFQIAKYDRPKPVITPHPHAEILAKYAEVAARRVDPWAEFEQYSYCDEDWFTLEVPTFFDAHLEYRHIGDEK